jgi:hypothetical protein
MMATATSPAPFAGIGSNCQGIMTITTAQTTQYR